MTPGEPDLRASAVASHASRDVSNASVGDLIGEVTRDMSTLMRQELALAKAEVRQEAAKAAKAGGMLGAAGFAGYMVLLFLSFAAWWGLASVLPAGTSAFIVAVIWGIVGFVLYSSGRKNLQRATPPMPETVETLKEDAQWAKRPRG